MYRHCASIITGCLAPLLSVLPAAAETRPGWREAFQSSPAAYEAPCPAMLRAVAERIKLPPEDIAERMKPQPLTGTARYRLTVTGAGAKLRIRISNEAGEQPLRLGSASVALADDEFTARASSMKAVTFGGAGAITVPPGAPVVSDPIILAVAPGTELLVSVSIVSGWANDARGGGMFAFAPGDQALRDTLQSASRLTGRPVVSGVSVLAAEPSHVIVAMGDSITDGNRGAAVALHGWPEQLSRRLVTSGKTGFTVVNAGISGNRLLAPGWGEAGLARLDRDALRIEGISHLILLEGTNDIGMSGKGPFGENPEIAATDLIAGYRQAIARAHARGVKVILGTLTPAGGSDSHSSPAKDAIREAVNHWIRTSGEANGVIDFDRITRDPAAPARFRREYDSGDHLHPSDAGYVAMADGIDLSMFQNGRP